MNPMIRAVLALDLMINCAEQAIPWLHELGPMGGTSFLQLSTLVVFAVAASEMRSIIPRRGGASLPTNGGESTPPKLSGTE